MGACNTKYYLKWVLAMQLPAQKQESVLASAKVHEILRFPIFPAAYNYFVWKSRKQKDPYPKNSDMEFWHTK